MVTPLQAKYSVLGWNHPGFGGSTVSMAYLHYTALSDYIILRLS